MISPTLFYDTIQSLIKYIKDNAPAGTEYFDFEGHAVETALPVEDLVGVQSSAIVGISDKSFICSVYVGVSSGTQDIVAQRKLVSHMYAKLFAQNTFSLFDETLQEIGTITVAGTTSVLPSTSSQARVFNPIEIELAVVVK